LVKVDDRMKPQSVDLVYLPETGKLFPTFIHAGVYYSGAQATSSSCPLNLERSHYGSQLFDRLGVRLGRLTSIASCQVSSPIYSVPRRYN